LHGEKDAHGNTIGDEDADNSPAGVCKCVGNPTWEDPEIQQDDRDLCGDDKHLVDELLDPESLHETSVSQEYSTLNPEDTHLEHVVDVFERDSPDILAHTILGH